MERALELSLDTMWPNGGNSYSKLMIVILQDTPSIGQDPCDMGQAFADANINILGISVGPVDTSSYLTCLEVEGASNTVTVARYESFAEASEALENIFHYECTAVISDATPFDGGWQGTGDVVNGKGTWINNDQSSLYWTGSAWVAEDANGNSMTSVGSRLDEEHPRNFGSWTGSNSDGDSLIYNEVTVICSATDIPTHYPTLSPTNPTMSPTRGIFEFLNVFLDYMEVTR